MGITLDKAQEAFRANPSSETAITYLNTAVDYRDDGMVEEATVTAAAREVLVWLREKRSK